MFRIVDDIRPAAARRRRPAIPAELRARVRRLEGAGGDRRQGVLPLGLDPVDAALAGGGVPLGCLHEVLGGDGAATAFAALLLARLAARRGRKVLWLCRRPDLHPPGLARYGLTADRLILARARRPVDLLWAVEEAARSAALAAVAGEAVGAGLTVSRRLQLAAEAGGVTTFLVRRDGPAATSSAVTRWRVAPLAARPVPGEPGLGPPRWRLELLRCRGGRPGAWIVDWLGPEQGLALAEIASAPLPRPANADAA